MLESGMQVQADTALKWAFLAAILSHGKPESRASLRMISRAAEMLEPYGAGAWHILTLRKYPQTYPKTAENSCN